MDLISEIRETLEMEVRPNSQGLEYLEAVVLKENLGLLISLLRKHLGPALKEPGEEASLPVEIEELVDSLGGLWINQSFFWKQDHRGVLFALLWPWESNPDKITLKAGMMGLDSKS